MGNCFSSKEKTPPTQRPAPQQQLLPNAPAGHHKIPGAGTPGPADAKLTHFGTVLQRNVETLHGQYTLGRELGRGHFGVTYLCTHVGTKQIFACKSISKKRKIITREDADEVRREVSIMHHLSGHANIVSLKESYEDHDHVHLVMELCSGGELLNHIARDRHYSERKAAKTFRTIMQVIAQAHALGVMHRDLKPENFILADCTPETRLKAADWGSATFFKPGQRFTNIVGQTYYIAPEVLRRSYGKSCDVWSAGVILYILLSGTPPFKADTKEGTFDLIKKGRFNLIGAPWDQISSQAKALLKRLLVVDPKHRITAAEALAHPWLKKAGEAPDTILPDTILSRLKSFGDSNHIKKLALTEIARKVPHHEIEGLHQLFKSFDKDNSGTITREEMRMGLKSMGQQHSEEELEAVMAAADLNGDEQVSYEEFIAATLQMSAVNTNENLLKAFAAFDLDGSGFISPEELREALNRHHMHADNIDQILKDVDQDGDGQIDYNEFAALMRSGSTVSTVSTASNAISGVKLADVDPTFHTGKS